ncbi:hypothetical protein HG536_0E05700 [Torulaspora globosa]|uniref:Uncharacterized protein n=1 Tax=Torulaspora globosa TaxID=48254 RepID=A0A7G3ZJH3_9SACH|nr:uncharacterized protein HG536_0E05700 [Torulaspora globosa]QLL33659.1 hypothetical protein HG536_0E05700 [Torulaspora globosa]
MVLSGSGCPCGFAAYPDHSTNALNPCFLSLVVLVEGVFFMVFGSIQLIQLVKESKVPESFKRRSLSQRQVVQLSNVSLFAVLIVCQLTAALNEQEAVPVLVWSLWIHLCYVVLISLPTQYLQYFKSPCALGNQLFYYMIQATVLGFQVAQRAAHYPNEDYNLIKGKYGAILEVGMLICSATIFVFDVYLFQPSDELETYYKKEGHHLQVNFLARATFTWMNELIVDTYHRKKLKDPYDLPEPPVNIDIRDVCRKLQAAREAQKWKGSNSLFSALMKTFGKSILIATLLETCKDLLSVVQPQLLRLFILSFDGNAASDYPPLNGFFVALGLFLVSVISACLQNQFYITIFEVGLGMRGALIALLYKKSLRLSLASREKSSTGDILNMASVDVLKIQRFFEDCQIIVGAPIQIVVVLLSLYWLLGPATIGGVVTMAIMIPINSFLSKRVKKLYKTQMKYKDARIRTTTEIINSMKSIKLYAWEKPMLDRLDHVRNGLEMENFKKIGVVSNLIFFAWNCVPLMVACSTFGMFSFANKRPLSPEIVFPALSLFNILNDAIYSLPNIINSVIETRVSMNRLKEFLLSDELDDSFMEVEETPCDKTLPVVEIKNATFLWKSQAVLLNGDFDDEESRVESSQVALKDVQDFHANKGELTCIVGRVGSGKSTMLRAILGQLPCISGSVEGVSPKVYIRASSIAYCPQEPWIMNASIKDNILFGHRYDETYYNATIEACQLLPDLDILPERDATLVGERGISLSGGQKARLSLARAVYSRADLCLLDDILSAVDAEVSKNIVEKVLDRENGLLKNKTVVLTTNAISVLDRSQMIYALEGGHIVEKASYKDVIASSKASTLKMMIEEFGRNIEYSSGIAGENHSVEEIILKSDANADALANDVTSLTSLIAPDTVNDLSLSSRRASMATLDAPRLFATDGSAPMTVEKKEEGRVKTSVYMFYMKACGVLGVALFLSFMVSSRIFDLLENFWLKYWAEENERRGSNEDVWRFVGIYAVIGVFSAAFNNLRTIVLLLYCTIRAATKLHDEMARSVLRSPMSFFETTPAGRILNRFSSDIQAVDSNLQWMFAFFFRSILNYLVTVVLISYNMPWFLAVNAVLLVVYLYYQTYYITLSRELKRLTSISVSPIMSLMGESLGGHAVINAFKHFDRFDFLNFSNVQFNINCNFNLRSTNRWLSVRLQTIGAFIVLTTALLSLGTLGSKQKLSPGMVGLLMSYALEVTSSLMWIVRMSVQIETNVVSVERIYEYCNLTPEAPEVIESCRPVESWPAQGKISFKSYSTKYKTQKDPALRNINIDIKPQEKIGVVGRTGAGKSTLSLALFRLLEATSGSIEIDDIDISTIGLADLRSHLGIIPQDAQAFEGSIRYNLDPFQRYSTETLWKAIKLSHLEPHVIAMCHKENKNGHQATREEMLETKITENGGNLSVGQRQLLCLSRALLNDSKVLVLDEATAAVDMETDKIIQETIRSEFKDKTILTIAHRIDTVLDSDRIIVLDAGEVKEFDKPENLLSNKQSLFYALCEKGGHLGKKSP